jgi:hypothetical protein
MTRSRISQRFHGPPTIGPILNGRRRALVGWNHTRDTPEGLTKGQIWGWTCVDGSKFQVYDTEFNRPTFRGMRADCGPANFTMIRM